MKISKKPVHIFVSTKKFQNDDNLNYVRSLLTNEAYSTKKKVHILQWLWNNSSRKSPNDKQIESRVLEERGNVDQGTSWIRNRDIEKEREEIP